MNKLRLTTYFVAFIITLLLLSLTYTFLVQSQAKTTEQEAIVKRDLSLQVANEVRQSSDDLTNAARAYVLTEDPRFLGYLSDMIGIRSGTVSRPVDYGNIYWDHVFATGEKPRKDTGKNIPLVELAEQVGFTVTEMELLKESLSLGGEKLGPIQNQAFNALKGRFVDKDGNYGKIGVPDKKLAYDLMYGPEMFMAKELQYEPLQELISSLESRTFKSIKSSADQVITYGGYILILFILIALATAVLGYLIVKQNRIELKQRQTAQESAEAENEQLNDSVINILQAVNSLSQKDLTARAPVTEDVIGTVSDSINLLAGETAKVLGGVTVIAGQVSSVSNRVRSQALQVSKTAEAERDSVNKMIDTLFTATQTMNQVAALAEQSNDSAEQATEVTENALQTVNKTVHGMEAIRETISETEKRIKRLGERSQEISGIVNLINTISERTHVLALNASMQAAVAGEAGRGFAVVAEEVQQLAESSRNATEQIATLVNNIQIETNETINTVNKTIGQVVEGSEQAQQAGEQMRRTQDITARLVSQVQNIAQASNQQKSMSADLLEAVQEIGDSAEKTAEQIEAQNLGTRKLQVASKNLVESVSVFTLPEQQESA